MGARDNNVVREARSKFVMISSLLELWHVVQAQALIIDTGKTLVVAPHWRLTTGGSFTLFLHRFFFGGSLTILACRQPAQSGISLLVFLLSVLNNVTFLDELRERRAAPVWPHPDALDFTMRGSPEEPPDPEALGERSSFFSHARNDFFLGLDGRAHDEDAL
jgi:hypothetical protein